MKERPILFSAPMVRAILAGTTTQTRRVIKGDLDDEARLHVGMYHPTVTDRHGQEHPGAEVFGAWTTDGEWAMRCPHGQPGDRLWVAESFSGPYCLEAQDGMAAAPPSTWVNGSRIWYWADGEPTHGDWTRPRPSIHMPRWASRITLEVTAVKVERLQDISEADAKAEGAEPMGVLPDWTDEEISLIDWPLGERENPYRNGYALLWESINGPGSWALNPWVWCVSFKRLEAA